MTAVFLTFTCARDEALVPIWAAAVRRLVPAAALVCCVDAADAGMKLPRKCHRFVSKFSRNGNLNGVDAVHGILSTIADAGEVFGADVVIKMDCDTVLTGASWLTWLNEVDYVGFEGGCPLTATGICYALRPDVARGILRAVTPWPWNTNGKLPEDQTICSLATLYSRARLVQWRRGLYVQAFLPGHFGCPEVPLRAAAAVHCGQAEFLSAYGDGLDRAALVRRAMLCLVRAGARAGVDSERTGHSGDSCAR